MLLFDGSEISPSTAVDVVDIPGFSLGFIHPRWLFGISSTNPYDSRFLALEKKVGLQDLPVSRIALCGAC